MEYGVHSRRINGEEDEDEQGNPIYSGVVLRTEGDSCWLFQELDIITAADLAISPTQSHYLCSHNHNHQHHLCKHMPLFCFSIHFMPLISSQIWSASYIHGVSESNGLRDIQDH